LKDSYMRRKKKDYTLQVSVTIPKSYIRFLDEEAEKLDISRSALICRAIDRERTFILKQAKK